MSQYIKQEDEISCGPVAIFNLLIKESIHNLPSYQEIFELCNKYENVREDGVNPSSFDIILRQIISKSSLQIRAHIYLCSLDSLIEHLKLGGCAIITYKWKTSDDEDTHYTFISELDGDELVMINDDGRNGQVISYKEASEIEEYFVPYRYPWKPNKNPYDLVYPQVWLISNQDRN